MAEQGDGSSSDIDELGEFEAFMRGATTLEQPQRPERDPAVVRRRVRRVLVGVLVPVLVIGAAVGGYVAWALNAPLPEPVRATVWEPEVPTTDAATISMPTTGAAAIAVSGGEDFLGTSGDQTWQSVGGDEARPIASITKLVTAMVVLDAHPIEGGDAGPTMSFGNADVAIYEDYYIRGAALAPVSRGATMSLRDVLRTVLIPSASNYATSMARWAFGSDAAFVQAADAWLDEHGLEDTRIVDATGLDPRNTSTPTDLLELARLAIADPVIAEIVGTKEITLDVPGTLVNTNDLLWDQGFTGLKTGTLSGSGSNLLYSATVTAGTAEPFEVVGVVLGGDSRSWVSNEVRRTIGSLQMGFERVEPVLMGTEITSYSTAWGDEVGVYVGSQPSLLVWGDTPIEAELELREPVDFADGEEIGTITWTAGTQTASAPLVIGGTIDPPIDEWRLQNPSVLLGG